MDSKSIVLEVVGYIALAAAIIDFIAVFVWLQRGKPKKAFSLAVTGIVLFIVFLGLIVLKKPQGDGSVSSPPVVEKQP